jgi:hypothetical protein
VPHASLGSAHPCVVLEQLATSRAATLALPHACPPGASHRLAAVLVLALTFLSCPC